jgi:hypothetical protein
MNEMSTPVAMIVFNRPESTRRVFAAVAEARPTHLLIIGDGARENRPGEAELCDQVRKIVTAVDWPCKVETNFAERNMGCRSRMISGLNWVFSRVEEAIILEDDCLPDQSLFPYCSELLERHRENQQIGLIAGFNPLEKEFPFAFSYYYSLPATFSIWGWATWRRAWQQYDESIRSWPEVKQANLLDVILPNKKVVLYWSKIFDAMYEGTGPDTWDYQWIYTCWVHNWLSIVPRRNLVQNIGFGLAATHTKASDPALRVVARTIDFPLHHPPAITAWPEHSLRAQKLLYTPGILRRLHRRLHRLRFAPK